MAKIYNVLRYVDDIKPNRFTDDTKIQWLNEVEGYIQTEVMMLALADVVQYDPEAHMHTDLLIKPPHDKLYALYLCAMIDFANGEYDKYANTMQLYNEFLEEYIGWYTLHFRPADGGCVREGYYLSAYAIAVAVNGFEGTAEEWLKSLKGGKGDPFEYEDFTPEQLEQLRGPMGPAPQKGVDYWTTEDKAEVKSEAEEMISSARTEALTAIESAESGSIRRLNAAADELTESVNQEVESAGDEKIGEIESAAYAEIVDITAAGTGQVQRIETAAEEEIQTVRSEGATQVGAIRGSVEDLMERAETAAGTAETARSDAQNAAGEAEAAAARAESSASSASTASMSAMGYSNQASRHSVTASVYAGQAKTSATNAETSANNATASKDAAETASEEAKSAAERVKEALGLYPTITLTPLTVAPGMPNAFRVTVKNADGTIQSETVENGVNGITPHIGHNGNWWIGGADTGVLAVAPTISVERDDNEGRVNISVEDGKGGYMFAWVLDGKPGVHVGSDAPPAGTRVWVNPNGNRTDIPQIDESLAKPGYAADAKAVGDALAKKLGADTLGDAVEDALRQAKESGEFDGEPGKDYVLTDDDKTEIAEEAAKLVEVPGEESYRLLKTITVTEAVEEISETYSVGYEGVIVTVENITLSSGSLQLYVTAGKDWTTRGVGASLQTNRVLRFVCRQLNGTWDIFGYQGLKGDASTMIGQISANAISAVSDTAPEGFAAGFDKINKIRVYSYSGYTLPVGMTIKIFVLGGDDNA